MAKFVVLEGLDGAGKTEIARYVQRELNGVYVHCGPTAPEETYDTYVRLVQFARESHVPVVFDRLHWGAYVYGSVYRDKPTLTIPEIIEIERTITSSGGTTVWVDRPVAACASYVLDDKDQYYVKSEDLWELHRLYEEIWSQMPHDRHLSVIRAKNTNELMFEAIKYLTRDLMATGEPYGI